VARESGRYDAYGKEMLRITTATSARCSTGRRTRKWSPTSSAYVKSYKDLPLNLYHIQWKFRDEIRPVSASCAGANS
jgi:prolyl-tRNA synthetase